MSTPNHQGSASKEELALRAGIDISFLSELENGKKEPCLRKMKEFSEGLGGTLSQLVQRLNCEV